MTEPSNGAPAPPKKRFGFKKKAATTAKTEDYDLFSHSNEFQDILAEETRQRNEEKKRAEEAQKRKAGEERERKRRKMSSESPGKVRESGGGAARGQRMASKGRSQTQTSPVGNRNEPTLDTLATRYESLTKSSSSPIGAPKSSEVIDLGDSDDDHNVPIPTRASPSPVKSIPIHSRRSPSEDLEEVDDPVVAELKAEIRAKAAARAAAKESPSTLVPSTQPPQPTAAVQLFIISEIPNTKPLIVKVKTDTTLARPKEAWCAKQGFTPAQTRGVFITWKDRKMFDTTKIERLGISIDGAGFVTVEGDPTIYDDENLPKIHVDAWTKEVFEARKEADALEAARAAEAAAAIQQPEPEPETTAEPQIKGIRLILKARGKEDFKIRVHATTEIGHLADAYKAKLEIPKEQPITLMFDGERLKPMDTVQDAEIDDMDSIEVFFK